MAAAKYCTTGGLDSIVDNRNEVTVKQDCSRMERARNDDIRAA